MNEPLVSIVIPTYNSEKTLPICMKSIERQTYRNIEIIVVDSYSTDDTVEIAKNYGAKVIKTHGGLLWSRYLGHINAIGEIEILLDSDQILNPTAIERGVRIILKGYDMLLLEEISYKPKTLMQWLFYFDRKHVHNIRDIHPIHGVLLARMYKREILDAAFKNINHNLPPQIMYRLVSLDHAIIYYESCRYSKRVSILNDAVYHIEPATLTQVVRKFHRYGKTELTLSKYYPELSRGKKTPRKINLNPESSISLLLWILKAIPYTLGKITANLPKDSNISWGKRK